MDNVKMLWEKWSGTGKKNRKSAITKYCKIILPEKKKPKFLNYSFIKHRS